MAILANLQFLKRRKTKAYIFEIKTLSTEICPTFAVWASIDGVTVIAKRGSFSFGMAVFVLPRSQHKDKFHKNSPYKIQFPIFYVLNSLVKSIVRLHHERLL